jgi:hypothetical protein
MAMKFILLLVLPAIANCVSFIGGAEKDVWGGKNWHYNRLYDGAQSTNVWHDSCYHSGSLHGWVEATMDRTYKVNSVKILNRGDCCASRAATLEAWVCDGPYGYKCVSCGQTGQTTSGAWLTVSCPSNAVGNVMRFTNSDWIQICEISVDGTAANNPGLEVTFDGGDEKDVWNNEDWHFNRLYDGALSTNVWDDSCYHSGTLNGWVEIYMDDTYQITEVSILNRADCCATRAATLKAFVCHGAGGHDCVSCGKYAAGTSGAWLTVNCPDNANGDTLRFTNSDWIQICEVRVEGKDTDFDNSQGRAYPKITGGDEDGTWSNKDWHYNRIYDNRLSTNVWDDSCYHSSLNKNAWVEIYLDDVYEIVWVSVLNRGDCCSARAITQVVKVCIGPGGGDCMTCGTQNEGPVGDWTKVKCPENTIGDTIRWENNDWIQICEAEFKALETDYVRPLSQLSYSGEPVTYEDADCDPLCDDFHRFCDDLAAGSKPQAQDDAEQAILDEHEFSCSADFYDSRCPKTCESCKKCEYAMSEHLEDLTDAFNDLITSDD